MNEAFEWPIPHGDASHSVGRIKKNDIELQVWFQKKTPHLSGTGHIEPDIRVMTSNNEDIFILELKDRYNGPIKHVQKVAENYSAGSLAQYICIANYSQFRNKELQNKLTAWKINERTVLLADQFKPNQIYPEIKNALREAIERALSTNQKYDLIFDVSGSVSTINIPNQLRAIIDKKGSPHSFFAFSNNLQPLGNSIDELRFDTTGGTDPIAAVNEYCEQGPIDEVREVVLLTDTDGIKKFRTGSLPKVCKVKVNLFEYGKDHPQEITEPQ